MTARIMSLPVLSEAQLQRTVTEACDALGLLWWHAYDSRRTNPGYPDLTIAGLGGQMWRELKTERGRVTKDQQRWLDVLAAGGGDAGVWRPSDLRSGRITNELKAISRRSRA